MPHLTLHRKAFLALAALLAALLLIFAGFSRLGLQRGLGPYVAEIELARMDWLAERLQAHHTQAGGWDSLRNQPTLWGRLTHPGGGPRRPGPPPSGDPGGVPNTRPGPPGTARCSARRSGPQTQRRPGVRAETACPRPFQSRPRPPCRTHPKPQRGLASTWWPGRGRTS